MRNSAFKACLVHIASAWTAKAIASPCLTKTERERQRDKKRERERERRKWNGKP